jgi:RimJ/RimL family protein N-acetyltransferase
MNEKNFILKNIDLDDVDFTYDLYQLRNNLELPDPISYEEQKKFVIDYINGKENSPFDVWNTIIINSKRIGLISLRRLNNEIGIWIIPEYQNKGIATLAIKIFMENNPRPYYTALIHTYNKQSQKYFKKSRNELRVISI